MIKNKKTICYELERYPQNCKECPAYKETKEQCWNDTWKGCYCELGFFEDANGIPDILNNIRHPKCKIKESPNVIVPNRVIPKEENKNILLIELGEDKQTVLFDVEWFVLNNFLDEDIFDSIIEKLIEKWIENLDNYYYEDVSECITEGQENQIIEAINNYIKEHKPKYTLKGVIKTLMDNNTLQLNLDISYEKEKIIFGLLRKLVYFNDEEGD